MPVTISRHYLTIRTGGKARRVHYRRAGKGPPLLLVHQSPRSSAEYEPLMRQWGEHFTCIAPDTAGFGQSDPLHNPEPEIEDFADALIEVCDALGFDTISAYGFHSGGIILVTALKRHMARFKTLAIGGYAIWNEAERVAIGPPYIPPNPPRPYGEHLVWLWNRILEQSWYFPWFDPDDKTRMPRAHDDPAQVDAVIHEMLDSGDFYRLGYGAVLRGPRDIPPPDAVTPPVLITAYTGDPLKVHLERLGELPMGWEAYGVETPEAHYAASLAHLQAHGIVPEFEPQADADAGFLPIKTEAFDGMIHWRGDPGSGRMMLHAPGREAELVEADGALAIDLPGHGLSGRWAGEAPQTWAPWQAVIDAVAAHFGTSAVEFEPLPQGEPQRLYPDLTPDRFGNYLTAAWAVVRASRIYSPWYIASKETAIPIDKAALAPERLAREHRALIRGAAAAKALHLARMEVSG
jgi:pimeloyl-ACP methyl ester carboxylesterase